MASVTVELDETKLTQDLMISGAFLNPPTKLRYHVEGHVAVFRTGSGRLGVGGWKVYETLRKACIDNQMDYWKVLERLNVREEDWDGH